MNGIFIAMLVNSALYLTGVFVAGLVWGDRDAVICSLFAMAFCYLAPLGQAVFPDLKVTNWLLVIFTIVAGAAAGVLLIM